jgi:asparagine synthase (glutamine-hydrolysing)
LFVARHDGAVLVTNNLPTLLDIPGLADDLDDAAVADFLLFGRNLHAERTTFARISRVPAAHSLIVTAQGQQLRRYWSIPMRDPPRRIAERDAQAEFREVLTKAVMDRVRADRIVISLSGGLDSNAVAATLTRQRTAGVSALTTVWNELFVDEEGRFAKMAADRYGIPIEFHVADRCEAFEGWDDRRVRGLEPTDEPCTALFHTFVAAAVAKGRVILTGEGGDPALYTSHDYFFNLLKRMRWLRFLRDAMSFATTRRQRPPLLLRSQLRLAMGRRRTPSYPGWIAPELEARLHLRDRWDEIYGPPRPPVHPYRAGAWHLIDSATWARTFEANDAGATGKPLEWSSPYFDVRLIELLFSLPPMPHFANKDIVRQGLRGWIPDELLRRKKTPLPTDPSAVRFEQTAPKWLKTVELAHGLDNWVKRPTLCEAVRKGGSQYLFSQQAFAVSLALWLSRRQQS